MQIPLAVRKWTSRRRGITRQVSPEFDVVMGLNYYWPYVSGLSEVARSVAEHLVNSGLRVRVVTTRFRKDLPKFETYRGVEIERTKVIMSVRNGVLSPALPFRLVHRIRSSSVGHLHLPMLEAGLSAFLARKKPLLVTYQCDYQTNHDAIGLIIRRAIDISSTVAMRHAASVVATSEDYAKHSRLYSAMRSKLVAIPPPYVRRDGGTARFRLSEGLHVGTLGRIVEEKGLDVLIRAFRSIDDPEARLLMAGDYASVAGHSVIDELKGLAGDDPRISFLGYLADAEVPDFLASLDVFAFPSVNPLEAFGITQLEAISAGLPVVASDLPGVRIPVLQSGQGVLVPPRDHESLARALLDPNLALLRGGSEKIGEPDASCQAYEVLLRDLMRQRQNTHTMDLQWEGFRAPQVDPACKHDPLAVSGSESWKPPRWHRKGWRRKGWLREAARRYDKTFPPSAGQENAPHSHR